MTGIASMPLWAIFGVDEDAWRRICVGRICICGKSKGYLNDNLALCPSCQKLLVALENLHYKALVKIKQLEEAKDGD